MPVVGFDHIVLPTSDAERFIEFYKRLGFSIIDENQWRKGETNRFAIQVGESKINVHPPDLKVLCVELLPLRAVTTCASYGMGPSKTCSR